MLYAHKQTLKLSFEGRYNLDITAHEYGVLSDFLNTQF